MAQMVSSSTTELLRETKNADKTTVNPGDTINFAVNIDLVGPMTSFGATIVLPKGLTLVPGNQIAVDAETIGFDKVNHVEKNLCFSGYSSTPYTANGILELVTLICRNSKYANAFAVFVANN